MLADPEAGILCRLSPNLTPEEPVGLMLRTEPSGSATLQIFVAVVRARAMAIRQQGKRRI